MKFQISKHKIIILCGGFGTRLQKVSRKIPKALMPIGDLVFLDLILDKLFKYENTHVYLSLHYKPDLFQEYVELIYFFLHFQE